jgi:hypothetical protein
MTGVAGVETAPKEHRDGGSGGHPERDRHRDDEAERAQTCRRSGRLAHEPTDGEDGEDHQPRERASVLKHAVETQPIEDGKLYPGRQPRQELHSESACMREGVPHDVRRGAEQRARDDGDEWALGDRRRAAGLWNACAQPTG